MSRERRPARRDPAWVWYAVAAALLVLLLVLQLSGVTGGLGP